MNKDGGLSATTLDPLGQRAQKTTVPKKRPEVYFHDTVVSHTPNGNISARSVLQPPVCLHSDRESSTTLSSIWDIEVQSEHKDISQGKEIKKEKRAPLVHFRRSLRSKSHEIDIFRFMKYNHFFFKLWSHGP